MAALIIYLDREACLESMILTCVSYATKQCLLDLYGLCTIMVKQALVYLKYTLSNSHTCAWKLSCISVTNRGASRGSVWLSWQTPLHCRYSALKPIKH